MAVEAQVRSIPEFARWLDRTLVSLWELSENPELDVEDRDSAWLVAEASHFARSVGAGHLAVRVVSPWWPEDAATTLGQMLHWCDKNWPADVPLTAKQAARRLNVSERTVRKLCARGSLGHHRAVGRQGKILITLKDIRDYQKNGQTRRRLRHL